MPRLSAVLAVLTLALLALPAAAQIAAQADACTLIAEERAGSLEHPWGVAFLPDGTALVTERSGRLLLVDPRTGDRQPVEGAPAVAARGQGGLLDIALHPDFASNALVYLSFSEPRDGGTATAVGRGRLVRDGGGMRLDGFTVITRMAKASGGGRHFGSRLAFAPDGALFVTMGERGDRPRAQDPFDHAGSVLRVNDDGSIPVDNPFADGRKGKPEIWSIGHRNPQGAAIHPDSGLIWTVEHGARGGDEINQPRPGRNYGWPVISYGRHYSGLPIGEGTSKPGMEQPVFYWDPSIAPSGMAFVTGPMFPAWRGDILVGALKDRLLSRLDMENGRVVAEERLFEGALGRIRDVRMGPDGAIWLLTDSPSGGLYRLTPEDGVCG
ncbi:MAG: PQQ-dependent sugar dehydrogenase [Alphaproteobacteria bacterium]|nr:PQQ-dependent sugar dehydrogenase [Alphaproteobacteria bacterium]